MMNEALRKYAKNRNVALWEIAEAEGISEPTLTRRLRKEYTPERSEHFKTIVDTIEKRKKEEETA